MLKLLQRLYLNISIEVTVVPRLSLRPPMPWHPNRYLSLIFCPWSFSCMTNRSKMSTGLIYSWLSWCAPQCTTAKLCWKWRAIFFSSKIHLWKLITWVWIHPYSAIYLWPGHGGSRLIKAVQMFSVLGLPQSPTNCNGKELVHCSWPGWSLHRSSWIRGLTTGQCLVSSTLE